MIATSSKTRGFSLIEVVVAMAITAILGTCVYHVVCPCPKRGAIKRGRFSVMGRILEARTEALTGRLITTGNALPVGTPGDFQGWAAQPKVRSAGFRVTSASTFEVFVDGDTQPGGEEVIHVTDSRMRKVTVTA